MHKIVEIISKSLKVNNIPNISNDGSWTLENVMFSEKTISFSNEDKNILIINIKGKNDNFYIADVTYKDFKEAIDEDKSIWIICKKTKQIYYELNEFIKKLEVILRAYWSLEDLNKYNLGNELLSKELKEMLNITITSLNNSTNISKNELYDILKLYFIENFENFQKNIEDLLYI